MVGALGPSESGELMRTAIFGVVAAFVMSGTTFAGPPPDELVHKLTETIRKHCPQATIEVTETGFVAKSGTMMFTLHGRWKTGEIDPKTFQEEGPNFKG